MPTETKLKSSVYNVHAWYDTIIIILATKLTSLILVDAQTIL